MKKIMKIMNNKSMMMKKIMKKMRICTGTVREKAMRPWMTPASSEDKEPTSNAESRTVLRMLINV